MDGTTMTSIELHGLATLDTHIFDFDFYAPAGDHLVVIGPNGAGKSTLLRILAGLLPLQSGILSIGGKVVDAPEQNIFLPAYKRSAVLQLQTGAVFPHMTVSENITFPLRAHGRRAKNIRTRTEKIIERFALSEIQNRLPSTLSGGQLSRVALARSLANEPEILLLDEPTSSIDAEASIWIRDFLKNQQTTLILVTHNPVEALLIGNSVLAIDSGKIIQTGAMEEVAERPASSWVAKFLDLNLLSASANGLLAEIDGGGSFRLAEEHYGPVHISFSASAISLYLEPPDGSPRNVWPVTITALNDDELKVRVGMTGPFEATALITQESLHHLNLRLGSQCWAAIKANELNIISSTILR